MGYWSGLALCLTKVRSSRACCPATALIIKAISCYSRPDNSEKDNSVWLVAPLISKLPSGVQGQVLKQAGQVLENSNTFLGPKSKLDKERNQRRYNKEFY